MTHLRSFPRATTLAACISTLFVSFAALAQGSPDLVISQVYGAGGNSGATYNSDFIEIFNRGTTAVSLAGKSLQYASATGTGAFGSSAAQLTVLPAVTLSPGQYFLVQESSGTGTALPVTPDLAVATNAINLSASAGKVALVNSTSTLGCNGGSIACSAAQLALIVDLVGYGGANFFEGTRPAPALTNVTSAQRARGGCADTDDNANDFTAALPAPRNSASAFGDCAAPTQLSAAGSADPATVSAGDPVTLSVTVTPGAHPTSTGISVAADLSSIGGSAAQAFANDGSGTTFIAALTVGSGVAPGARALPVSVTDAQGRSATASIALTVTPAVPAYAIHEIQGAGLFSPHANELVQTEGIVTGVKTNGFFIQAPDFEADSDPATSEGIFVFTSSTPPPAAATGNRVRVRGRVQDFIPASDPLSPPATEISGSPTVAVVSTGNPLPLPITLTAADYDPRGSVTQLAKYEGMRVHVDEIVVVAPTGGTLSEPNARSTSNGAFYGVLPGVLRPFREPGIEAPTVAPAGVPQFDGNPERVRVDTDGIGGSPIDVATGATVADLTGPLDLTFRSFTINVDPGTSPIVAGNDLRAVPVRAGAGEGEVMVASFNLERFYDSVNDPATSDAVLTPAAVELRLTKASLAIRNVLRMPDVIGVEEMENLSNLQALAVRIDADAAAAGQIPPGYQAFLAEGNDIGGIDVGLLVKASRIEVVNVEQLGKDTTYVQPDGTSAILNDRPPLVLTANVRPVGKELPFGFTFIVNHLRSLTGVDGTDGARIRLKRLEQARFLARLIDGYQQFGEKVISVGDYNAFDVNDGYVDVIDIVRGGPPHPSEDVLGEPNQLVATPLVDLAPADPAQHYSYVFDGNAQVLDHIIVSQSLVVNEFTYARNDADFPESLRGDATRPERISDHDAPVAYLAVPRDTVAPVVTLTGPADGATYLLGQVPAAACNTTDSGSGVRTPASLRISGGDANGVGAITATCSGAVDNVGNTAADVSVHYTVVAYTFSGFFAPVGAGTSAKSGSTIPLKFAVSDWNGAQVTSTDVVKAIQVAADASCSGSASGAWQAAAAAGDTVLRWDGAQFVFNWKTTGLAAGCYVVAVKTADTLVHGAPIRLR